MKRNETKKKYKKREKQPATDFSKAKQNTEKPNMVKLGHRSLSLEQNL